MVPLLKKPDLERNNPSACRPISLTSYLCKIMERILNDRLRWWLESNKLIHQCQSGFRAKRSTKDRILRLHDDIYKAIPNKRSTLAVFLDLEKAYWRDGLLYKLGALGITGTMFRWIRSFLNNRSFQVRVGSTLSDRYVLDNGIPRGSVLSPLPFSIMMNDLRTFQTTWLQI